MIVGSMLSGSSSPVTSAGMSTDGSPGPPGTVMRAPQALQIADFPASPSLTT